MKVYSGNGTIITLVDEPISSGGEGQIHKISAPAQLVNNCVKIYFKHKRTRQREDKIRFMVQNPPSMVKGKGFLIGWPLDIVFDTHRDFMGFMMYLAPTDSHELVNLTATKVSKKLGQEWHQYYERTNGKFALVSRLKLIHNIAIPIHLLHSTNKYVLKDFKPQNVLVTRNGSVTLVDMDSIQISERNRLLYPGEVLTPDYIPPEYYSQDIGRDPKMPLDNTWDNFEVAVVFYQILFGLHPYVVTPKNIKDDSSSEIHENVAHNLFPFGPNKNAIESFPPLHNKFNALPSTIQTLFTRAFSSNPNERPNIDEWGRIIHTEIISCGPVPPPPPPIKKHKVRFLSPDGRVLKETWVIHGQKLSVNQVPTLPVVNGTACQSWDKDPANETILTDREYRAELPSNNDDNDYSWIGWIGLIVVVFFVLVVMFA